MRPEGIPLGLDARRHEVLIDVEARVRELAPMHAGRDYHELFSRVVTPELAPDYRSLVYRAAFAVLAAAARDAADEADPTTGTAA